MNPESGRSTYHPWTIGRLPFCLLWSPGSIHYLDSPSLDSPECSWDYSACTAREETLWCHVQERWGRKISKMWEDKDALTRGRQSEDEEDAVKKTGWRGGGEEEDGVKRKTRWRGRHGEEDGWRGRRGRQGDEDEEEVRKTEDEDEENRWEKDWEKGKGAHGKDQHWRHANKIACHSCCCRWAPWPIIITNSEVYGADFDSWGSDPQWSPRASPLRITLRMFIHSERYPNLVVYAEGGLR